jgi:hypothetical protein
MKSATTPRLTRARMVLTNSPFSRRDEISSYDSMHPLVRSFWTSLSSWKFLVVVDE